MNPLIKGAIAGLVLGALFCAAVTALSGCASGPLCKGTAEEIQQCQEQMARARENRMDHMGGGRR